MHLQAVCELAFEVHDETPLVAMLRARRAPGQRVLRERLRIGPELVVREYQDVFGNRCQRLTAPPGPLSLVVETLAEVRPAVEAERDAARVPVSRLPDEALQFTLPSRYCPSDKLTERARAIVAERAGSQATGQAEVHAIRDYVHDTLAYRYGVSTASTDAEETLRAGAGVCRDFAHVAIALCRSIDIPARMVVGYLQDLAPMDLHAWFEAYVGGRWQTFDASEDTLEGGRIVLAYGRDAADVAFLTDYGSLQLKTMRVAVEKVSELSTAHLELAGPSVADAAE